MSKNKMFFWVIIGTVNLLVLGLCIKIFTSKFDIIVYRKETSDFMKTYNINVKHVDTKNNFKEVEAPLININFREVHPYAGFKTEPNIKGSDENISIKINSLGQRSPEINKIKEDGVVRVAILGGSVAFQGKTNDTSIIGYVASRFKDMGFKTEFINTGTLSFNTTQELSVFMHDVLAFQPDFLISLDGFNDIHNLLYDTRIIGWPTVVCGEKKTGYYKPIEPQGELTEEKDVQLVLENYFFNIQLIARICEAFNIKYMAVLQPWREYSEELCEFKENLNRGFFLKSLFYCFAKEQFKKWDQSKSFGARYISCAGFFQKDKSYYTDEVHFNDEGNKLIAEHIVKEFSR